nr:ABC transporter ATP-binding protein [Maliibacterium massiliense]
MNVLSVSNLRKRYAQFALKDVSFDLRPGAITGFIGRNGAGKTTTLKSLMHLVHPDGGTIRFFGMDFAGHELEIKQRIGFVTGGINYYPTKKLGAITAVTRGFYRQWDDAAYRSYMQRFGLDEGKTPKMLSEGMKVKYALALALSHHATLLLLDEPTSGLDPVSRDELLDIFLTLAAEEKVSILFSTHITSDLEKCADDIIYIKNGAIVGQGRMEDFLARYRAVRLDAPPTGALAAQLVGCKRTRAGYSALARAQDLPCLHLPGEQVSAADLETIMIHMERA